MHINNTLFRQKSWVRFNRHEIHLWLNLKANLFAFENFKKFKLIEKKTVKYESTSLRRGFCKILKSFNSKTHFVGYAYWLSHVKDYEYFSKSLNDLRLTLVNHRNTICRSLPFFAAKKLSGLSLSNERFHKKSIQIEKNWNRIADYIKNTKYIFYMF